MLLTIGKPLYKPVSIPTVKGNATAELGPGDVGSIPPGHDAWVVGDEPFMSIDFGDALYAKQQS